MKANKDSVKISIFKALCDPTRLKLLSILSKKEECACALPLQVRKSQPTVSLHLLMLLKAGLVRARKSGTRRLYSLSARGKRVLRDISRWAEAST
jgi:ArsR family transcriptional regulator